MVNKLFNGVQRETNHLQLHNYKPENDLLNDMLPLNMKHNASLLFTPLPPRYHLVTISLPFRIFLISSQYNKNYESIF